MRTFSRGQSLIEILVAIGVFAIIAVAIGSFLLDAFVSFRLGKERTQAIFLGEEGLEAARSIRNQSWTNLTDGDHGLSKSSGVWSFAGADESFTTFFDPFRRVVTVEPVDANTKRIRSNISWQFTPLRAHTIEFATHLTNWISRIGNWALPFKESVFDLTLALTGNDTQSARSIAVEDQYLYLARDSSAGREFFVFDLTSLPAPPQLVGQTELAAGRSNDLVVSGNYAYTVSNNDTQELQVIDVSNPAAPALVRSFDLTSANSGSANADALSVAITGNYLLIGRNGGDRFLVVDVTNPLTPFVVGRTSTVTGDPNGVVTNGQYAYVASTVNNAELQIVDIQNPALPSRIGVLNLASGADGADALSIALASPYVFIGRVLTAGAPEFYVISVANPAAPALIPTPINLTGEVRGIAYDASAGYSFLATGDGANDFQVIDTRNPAAVPPPPPFGELNILNGPRDLVYSFIFDRVFIASSNSNEELQIIAPSP
ncbi:MAG: prepilin-type N-terminal cleavage/methylation domain-containing protein [Parcubacteria group bacterium]|nr:prepilin-type N-terminal cleavage/methylation domain-containing protein [Parcubacteria group bacterium]